jgi:biotin operon repressor
LNSQFVTNLGFVNAVKDFSQRINDTSKLHIHFETNTYERFSKDNKEYFQMQETIALEIGVSVSTVKRSIRQLEKIGLVEVARKKSLDKKRNKYKLHKFSELSNIRLFSEGYKLAGGDGWFWSSGKNIEKIIPIKHRIVTERKQAEPVVDPYLYNNYEFEDDGCPF